MPQNNKILLETTETIYFKYIYIYVYIYIFIYIYIYQTYIQLVLLFVSQHLKRYHVKQGPVCTGPET